MVKELEAIFYNFVLKKDLHSRLVRTRIAKKRLETSVKMGGFGMVTLSTILNGLYAKQLSKLTLSSHPLALLVIPDTLWLHTSFNLNKSADTIAVAGHRLLKEIALNYLYNKDHSLLTSDKYCRNVIASSSILNFVRDKQLNSTHITRLVHIHNICSLGDAVNYGNRYKSLIKKVLKAKASRLLIALWAEGTVIPEVDGREFFPVARDKINTIDRVTSKQFRTLLTPTQGRLSCEKINADPVTESMIIGSINRVKGIRHRNSLLRVWNGDVLSNDRLFHMGIAQTNACNFCGCKETPDHRLISCNRAKAIWQALEPRTGDKIQVLKDLFELDYDFETTTLKLELISTLINDSSNSKEFILNKSIRYISQLQRHSKFADQSISDQPSQNS